MQPVGVSLVRIIHWRISQPQSRLTSQRPREQWAIARGIYEAHVSIFHVPQKKYKEQNDKAGVITDFMSPLMEEELLSSRWLGVITGTFSQENHLGGNFQ